MGKKTDEKLPNKAGKIRIKTRFFRPRHAYVVYEDSWLTQWHVHMYFAGVLLGNFFDNTKKHLLKTADDWVRWVQSERSFAR